MHRWIDLTTLYCATLVLLLALVPASATIVETVQTPARKILPSDVFVHVSRVRAELELLRLHMGKPKDGQQVLIVQNAAPREVFYQAMTLFDKSNQLSFDQMRVRSVRPYTPKNQIQPSEVFSVVDQALARINEVKAKLGITKTIKIPEHDPSKTPTDVFLAIVQANRQLNLLLDQRFAPKDVFKQVSQAIGYSARLLAYFPDTKRIPPPEALQHGKRPVDVFQRLVGCYESIRVVGEKSGFAMLHLDTNTTEIDIVPSDVYDIASLIVSELAYLHSKLENARPPRPVFDPGRKFPSHVFQRVGILESQLKTLSTETKRSPLWLSNSPDQAAR